MSVIKIGICGYGNIGRGVELAVNSYSDMELVGIFTRRAPESVKTVSGAPVFHYDSINEYKDKIDVMILCGGSATDLPVMGPELAENFCTIDSFDNHSKIPEYFASMDKAAKKGGNISIISVGWDPGLFSIMRILGECVLPNGGTYTFWGKGVSQGHSDAIRRIEGVADARQYTIPIESAIERIRSGERPELSAREKHLRECFVVAKDGADKAAIEHEIKTMPAYFADYDTIVHFIDADEMKANHSAMPHGGFVIRSGETSEGTKQVVEYSLKLDSNPEFTSSVLAAYARAAYRLSNNGESGARSVFDIAPVLLSPKSAADLRKELL